MSTQVPDGVPVIEISATDEFPIVEISAIGMQGPPGPQGEPGYGIQLAGSVETVDDLPPATEYMPGDGFIVESDGHMWIVSDNGATWVDAGAVQGPQGPAGPPGEDSTIPGPAGPQGPPGGPGPQGSAGQQGVKGDTGDPGPRGLQGVQGVAGPAGVKGSQGDVGPTGPAGSPGPQGTQGPAGATGPAGLNWKGDWSASTNYSVDDAVGHSGSSWFAAVDPPVGAVPSVSSTYWELLAAQGPVGPQGTQGPTGATGPSGPEGVQGVPGPTGLQGPTGPQGTPGPQGTTGAQGLQGVNGADGPPGPTGPTGAASTVPGPTGPAGSTGPAGPGLAAGGTTNQLAAKNSNTDYDTKWVTLTGLVPAGGAARSYLKKKTATDYDVSWITESGRWRGVWAADALTQTINFASSGAVPAPFTLSHDGTVTTTDASLDATSSYPTAANLPPGVTGCMRIHDGTLTGGFQRVSLALASLGIANITRVKCWYAVQAGSGGSAGEYQTATFRVNGSSVLDQVSLNTVGIPWQQFTFSSLTSAATISWEQRGNQSVTFTVTNGLGVGYLEVYAAGEPFMTEDYVTYNDSVWRSTVDNNSSTPGADANWVKTIVGVPPGGSATQMLAKTSGADYAVAWQNAPSSGGGGATSATGAETWSSVVTALTGKVHRWKFDDPSGATVADSVGSLPLTLSGTYTRNSDVTPSGTASTFFGGTTTTGAVSSGLGSIPVGNNARTIVTLFKTPTRAQGTLCEYGAQTTRNAFGLSTNNASTPVSSLTSYVWADDNNGKTLPPTTDGAWHMGATTYDANRGLGCYLDSDETATQTAADISTTAGGNFCVGQQTTGTIARFNGNIAEVIVFNRVLSKAELDRLYRTLTGTSSANLANATGFRTALATNGGSATTGAWNEITGLATTFTPTADGWLEVDAKVTMQCNASGDQYARVSISPAPVSGSVSDEPVANQGRGINAMETLNPVAKWKVAAGVTYTIKVYEQHSAGTSLVQGDANSYTEVLGVFTPTAMSVGVGSYVPFTPGAPTAVTTNPSLGTGPTQTGQRYSDGTHLEADVYYKTGTSPSIGSGPYRFPLSVPVVSPLPGQVLGSGWLYEAGGVGIVNVIALAVDVNTYKLFKTHPTAFEVSSANDAALFNTAGSEIGLHLSYRVA